MKRILCGIAALSAAALVSVPAHANPGSSVPVNFILTVVNGQCVPTPVAVNGSSALPGLFVFPLNPTGETVFPSVVSGGGGGGNSLAVLVNSNATAVGTMKFSARGVSEWLPTNFSIGQINSIDLGLWVGEPISWSLAIEGGTGSGGAGCSGTIVPG